MPVTSVTPLAAPVTTKPERYVVGYASYDRHARRNRGTIPDRDVHYAYFAIGCASYACYTGGCTCYIRYVAVRARHGLARLAVSRAHYFDYACYALGYACCADGYSGHVSYTASRARYTLVRYAVIHAHYGLARVAVDRVRHGSARRFGYVRHARYADRIARL